MRNIMVYFFSFRFSVNDGDYNSVSSAYETMTENCVFQDDVSTPLIIIK